ncbi:hypothetical protein GPECTOR_80g159 [Gonium pectorale]|uniref:Reticulon-like protein n=1 Tax=Gonium pectorale TaxID=33097 RepID=A0A150G1N9_GONPE|nr:hypothetical protein GPECTOR_80g159 [Gonium pectorale]|eukprot:KXZ43799.1 hypothetical protein GPECTOR_80g159 [Gonium pectorale]
MVCCPRCAELERELEQLRQAHSMQELNERAMADTATTLDKERAEARQEAAVYQTETMQVKAQKEMADSRIAELEARNGRLVSVVNQGGLELQRISAGIKPALSPEAAESLALALQSVGDQLHAALLPEFGSVDPSPSPSGEQVQRPWAYGTPGSSEETPRAHGASATSTAAGGLAASSSSPGGGLTPALPKWPAGLSATPPIVYRPTTPAGLNSLQMADLQEKDASAKDSPVGSLASAMASEMKTAFGSPHEATPEKPAATPDVNPAKQLDFNINPPTPATPAMVGASSSDELDYNAFITETLLWTNKVRSTFYFVAGFLAWLAVRGVFSSSTTLFTGVCYVLLFSLIFNFLRGAVAPRLQERCTWSDSGLTRLAAAAATTAISAAAALHDRHLNGLDPLKSLEVGLGLWVLSLLGRALDAVTLLLLLHLGAFSVPLGYKMFKGRIDAIIKDVYGKAKAHYEKLDRRVRGAVVLVPLILLVFLLPVVDRLVVVFICLAYARVLTRPDEYAALQRRVAPVGTTLNKKVLTPITAAASSALTKYDITPTPSKKKRS